MIPIMTAMMISGEVAGYPRCLVTLAVAPGFHRVTWPRKQHRSRG